MKILDSLRLEIETVKLDVNKLFYEEISKNKDLLSLF
jgi:hypothetical protein